MNTMIKATMIVILCGGLNACAHWSSAEQGTAIGGVTGAAVGNALTGGLLGTVGGAAAGAYIGHEIGEDQDRKHRR
jgi:osmotically inducible lipoprotein OsmB